jgi:hypothetical protein
MTTVQGSYSVERLPEESERAYLGYCCFRDIGLSRTLHGAYVMYLTKSNRLKSQKIGTSKRLNPSPDFRRWQIEYKWDERVKQWDTEQESTSREMALASSTEAYAASIEAYQSAMDEFAKGQLADSIKARNALSHELDKVIECATGNSLDVESLLLITRTQKELAQVVELASSRLERSLSIAFLLADMQGFH